MTTLAPNEGAAADGVLDELIDPMVARLSRAVEPLQVAAILESEGLNDRIARDRYGHPDVFSLAEAAYSRMTVRGRDLPRRPRPASCRSAPARSPRSCTGSCTACPPCSCPPPPGSWAPGG